jgi:hypothetical protein
MFHGFWFMATCIRLLDVYKAFGERYYFYLRGETENECFFPRDYGTDTQHHTNSLYYSTCTVLLHIWTA